MLLSGALFALFMTGFWLYCLTDAILTPASDCRHLSKPAWIAVIVVTFIVGAVAWLIVRRPPRDAGRRDEPGYLPGRGGLDGSDAARQPAGRVTTAGAQPGPKGPDDDPEFLRALGRAIHGNRQAGPEA